MKRGFFTLATLVLIASLALFGCKPPVVDPEPTDSPADLASAVQNSFLNLPVLKMKLPGSLSANAGQASQSRRNIRFNEGDTTELTTATLPGLKSQAWYELQDGGENIVLPYVNAAFAILRKYAESNTIPVDQVFEVPMTVATLADAVGADPEEMEEGMDMEFVSKFMVKGESKDDFSIYADIGINIITEGAAMAIGVKSRIDVLYAGADQALEMFINITDTMTSGADSMSQSFPMYATYDSATGACVTVAKMEQEGRSSGYLSKSTVDSEGAVSSVTANYNDGVADGISAAFGNDSYGGIASRSNYMCTIYNSDGSTTSENRDSYWGEYYDANGELIRRDNGTNRLWVPVYNESQCTNLASVDFGFTSAPATYRIRSSSSNIAGTYYWTSELQTNAGWMNYSRNYSVPDGDWHYSVYQEYSTDWEAVYRWCWNSITSQSGYQTYLGDNNWGPLSPDYPGSYSNDFIFKAGANWVEGDAVYYCSGWSNDGTYSYQDYYQGYTVPASETRMGKQYWFDYQYPLKRLLPLSADYASAYKLIQEEGRTDSDSWINMDGQTQNWTWTNYTYYLNKNLRDLDGDGTIDAEPVQRFDEGFDIRLDKLSQYEMYFWNRTTDKLDKTKAYMFTTTGTLPPYFTNPGTSVISAVDSKLAAIMETAYSSGIEEYDAKLVEVATATAGVF